jgi:hypothetical protein
VTNSGFKLTIFAVIRASSRFGGTPPRSRYLWRRDSCQRISLACFAPNFKTG